MKPIVKPRIRHVDPYDETSMWLHTLTQTRIQDMTISKQEQMVWEEVEADRITLEDVHAIEMEDVKANHWNTRRVIQSHCCIRRCVMNQSSLLAWQWEDCLLEDVVFVNCDLYYSSFVRCTFKRVQFVHCVMDQVQWFHCDIKQIAFDMCKLTHNEFHQTSWKDVDFANSDLSGLRSDQQSLQGAIINDRQAVMICRMMGYTVKEQDI